MFAYQSPTRIGPPGSRPFPGMGLRVDTLLVSCCTRECSSITEKGTRLRMVCKEKQSTGQPDLKVSSFEVKCSLTGLCFGWCWWWWCVEC